VGKAGVPFPDPDAAAIAAIDEINSTSIMRNVEFAGRILKTSSAFTFTQAQTLNQRDDSDPGLKVAGSIGSYHTHSGEFERTDEQFSPMDLLKATMGKELSYVGTPRGRILKFTPVNLLSGFDQSFNPTGLVETLRSPTYNTAQERGTLVGRWKVDRPRTSDQWDTVFFPDSRVLWTQGSGANKFVSLGEGIWSVQNDEVVILWRADLQEFWPLPLRSAKEIAQEQPGNRLVARKTEGSQDNPHSKFSVFA
jgi:hypothetical protein